MEQDGAQDRRPTDDVRPGTRWLLIAFAVLTALAVNQLLVFADVADRFWAWAIPTELTAAFLGAAYAAGFVLAVVALRQREWSRIRVPVVTVTAFTWLTAVATGIHLHKFHLTSGGPIAQGAAWVWHRWLPFDRLQDGQGTQRSAGVGQSAEPDTVQGWSDRPSAAILCRLRHRRTRRRRRGRP